MPTASHFTCSACKQWQAWEKRPAYMGNDYENLLCHRCGPRKGAAITIQWDRIAEPTNKYCSQCCQNLTADLDKGAPWTCDQHALTFCGRCGSTPKKDEHHRLAHNGEATTWIIHLIEAKPAASMPIATENANAALLSNAKQQQINTSQVGGSSPHIRAPGYLLYMPPDPIRSRFVMLDESESRFYDVDARTPLLGNPPSWNRDGISAATLGAQGKSLAIVFPTLLDKDRIYKLKQDGRDPDFKVGNLVALKQFYDSGRALDGVSLRGRVVGKVNVRPAFAALNWDSMIEQKGSVLPTEMKAGLLTKLWGHDLSSYGGNEFATNLGVLEKMPRKWHRDPKALNFELDNLFVAGRKLESSDWELDDHAKLLKPIRFDL